MSLFNFFKDDDEFADLIASLDRVSASISTTVSQSQDSDSGISSIIYNLLDTESFKYDKVKSKNLQYASEIETLFQSVSIPDERVKRYRIYDEIYETVPLIKRIFKVYIANILQKNPTNPSPILVKFKTSTEIENHQKVKSFVDKFIDFFKIPNKIKQNILPTELLYGDCFVEIIDVKEQLHKLEKRKEFQKSHLFESTRISSILSNNIITKPEKLDSILNSIAQSLIETVRNDIYVDKSSDILTEETPELVDNNELVDFENTNIFNRIILRVHKPHNIIVLQTKYQNRIGYLEVLEDQTSNTSNLTKSLQDVVSKISNLSAGQSGIKLTEKQVSLKLSKLIVKNIFKDKVKDISAFINSLDDVVYSDIAKLIVDVMMNDKDKRKVKKVRFIPVNRMVHFNIPSANNEPYGDSIVDPLVFPAKLYILAQLSNVITKLSRAALVRKWKIEAGPGMMHGNLVQKLKRELYNTRVTIDDIGSIKTMSKIFSDFKDFYTITRQGTPMIDVDVASHGDPSVKIADLEDARREIIAISGVPATYLGYMDVVELREQLVHINVSFATDIADIQETVNNGLLELTDIIAEIVDFGLKPSDYINITLIPPVVLLLQLIETTLSSAGNISGVFQNLQLPFDFYSFLDKYVPYDDWDKFREKSEKFKARQRLTQGAGQQGGGGPMGGF